MFVLLEVVQHWAEIVGVAGILCVGAGLGRIFWPTRRTGKQLPVSDEQLLDVAYTAGVAKAREVSR